MASENPARALRPSADSESLVWYEPARPAARPTSSVIRHTLHTSVRILPILILILGCSRSPKSEESAPQPATPLRAEVRDATRQPNAPLPTEVAGFRFGMSVVEFEDQCKKVGTPNALVGGDDPKIRKHTCDQVEVQPGMRLNVFLGFCEGDSRLCEINYWTRRSAARIFTLLNTKLTSQFGPSPSFTSTLREDALEEQCAQREGKIRRTWWWGTPPAVAGRLLIAFSCKPGESSVGVYVDDPLAAAAQLELARSQGVVTP